MPVAPSKMSRRRLTRNLAEYACAAWIRGTNHTSTNRAFGGLGRDDDGVWFVTGSSCWDRHESTRRWAAATGSRHRSAGRAARAASRIVSRSGGLNSQPPCASIAERNTSSCAARAFCIKSASVSHRPVEPSISVNRNVTTPEGGPPCGHPHRMSHRAHYQPANRD
jgi:hypothetical protein